MRYKILYLPTAQEVLWNIYNARTENHEWVVSKFSTKALAENCLKQCYFFLDLYDEKNTDTGIPFIGSSEYLSILETNCKKIPKHLLEVVKIK